MKQDETLAFVRRIWARVVAYAAHDDPMVESCNLIALVVVSNQPFYPLYIYWTVSEHISPTFFTFLSTPFFLAVPAVSRRSSVAGRALLPLAGIANTVLSVAIFGRSSGVEIFLIPCALIAATFFRGSERVIAFPIIGIALLAYFEIDKLLPVQIHPYSASEYAAFFSLNATSASTLVIFVGLIASGLLSRGSQGPS